MENIKIEISSIAVRKFMLSSQRIRLVLLAYLLGNCILVVNRSSKYRCLDLHLEKCGMSVNKALVVLCEYNVMWFFQFHFHMFPLGESLMIWKLALFSAGLTENIFTVWCFDRKYWITTIAFSSSQSAWTYFMQYYFPLWLKLFLPTNPSKKKVFTENLRFITPFSTLCSLDWPVSCIALLFSVKFFWMHECAAQC